MRSRLSRVTIGASVTNAFLLTSLAVLVACGLIGAVIARSRGYTPLVGFLVCFPLGVIGITFILVVRGSLETPAELKSAR